ncbi:hypothetical protein HYU15_01520 [Candidatus Woesearchaeota archaeon]|nr:hypothetical protein [Candidatus Woesearchaeota archaeon]
MVIGITALIFRRGTGIFKLLFAIDDSIRLISITLLLWMGLAFIGAPKPVIMAGIVLGIIIDAHDITDALSKGKPVDLGFG